MSDPTIPDKEAHRRLGPDPIPLWEKIFWLALLLFMLCILWWNEITFGVII